MAKYKSVGSFKHISEILPISAPMNEEHFVEYLENGFKWGFAPHIRISTTGYKNELKIESINEKECVIICDVQSFFKAVEKIKTYMDEK